MQMIEYEIVYALVKLLHVNVRGTKLFSRYTAHMKGLSNWIRLILITGWLFLFLKIKWSPIIKYRQAMADVDLHNKHK